jgi:hypothetical protein
MPNSEAEAEEGIVQASVRTVQGLIAPFSATRKCDISIPLPWFCLFSVLCMLTIICEKVKQIHWVWR